MKVASSTLLDANAALADDDARELYGLLDVQTFVEAHGERIWVEDAPGKGARFVFTMPAVARNGK